MDTMSFIPAYQPLPFPLPVWLMQILLILGFFLHALPMNVMLGGGFICAALFLAGKHDQTSNAFRAARALAMSLPLFISFAITQGIVPLLFVQLLYGPMFYTSSILMAVPWLTVIPLVLASYYISYIVIYRILLKEHNAGTATKSAILLTIMGVMLAVVGFFFSNIMTLMLTPDKWVAMYQHSSHGLNLNLHEGQLIPRYTHFVVAAFAVAGMTLGCFGLYMLKREEQFGQWMIRLGSKIFLYSTIVQIPVGLWFLFSLPQQMSSKFLGGDIIATAVFGTSMALALVCILATTISSNTASKPAFLAGLIGNALLILAMIVNRHLLRLFYLNPHIQPESMPVATQWDLFIIFLVSTVALIAYLVWLCRLVWTAFQKKAPDATAMKQAGAPAAPVN